MINNSGLVPYLKGIEVGNPKELDWEVRAGDGNYAWRLVVETDKPAFLQNSSEFQDSGSDDGEGNYRCKKTPFKVIRPSYSRSESWNDDIAKIKLTLSDCNGKLNENCEINIGGNIGLSFKNPIKLKDICWASI